MADEIRNPNRFNTETYGPARHASQPMRTRDFTGSSLCHIMQNITLMQTGKKVRDERKNDLIAECSLVHVNK